MAGTNIWYYTKPDFVHGHGMQCTTLQPATNRNTTYVLDETTATFAS